MANEFELINKMNNKIHNLKNDNKQYHFRKGIKVNIPINNKYVTEEEKEDNKKICCSCKNKFEDFEWNDNLSSVNEPIVKEDDESRKIRVTTATDMHKDDDNYVIDLGNNNVDVSCYNDDSYNTTTSSDSGFYGSILDENNLNMIARRVIENLKKEGVTFLDEDDKNYEIGYFDVCDCSSKTIANIFFHDINDITFKLNPLNLINFVRDLKTNINHLYLTHNN